MSEINIEAAILNEKNIKKVKKPKNVDRAKKLESFQSILEFTQDLAEIFETTKNSPIGLYNRLITTIKISDDKAISGFVSGFQQFFLKNKNFVFDDKLREIPQGTIIRYDISTKIYLDIQKYIHKSDDSTLTAIRKHLLIIGALLESDIKEMEKIENILSGIKEELTDSDEGQFVKNIMDKASNLVKDVDINNPMAAIGSLMNGGLMKEMFSGIENGGKGGKMNMKKLMKTMMSTMEKITDIESDEEDKSIKEVKSNNK